MPATCPKKHTQKSFYHWVRRTDSNSTASHCKGRWSLEYEWFCSSRFFGVLKKTVFLWFMLRICLWMFVPVIIWIVLFLFRPKRALFIQFWSFLQFLIVTESVFSNRLISSYLDVLVFVPYPFNYNSINLQNIVPWFYSMLHCAQIFGSG